MEEDTMTRTPLFYSSILLASAVLVLNAQVQEYVTRTPAPLVVDGSINPERISDRTAAKVFLLSIAEPPHATPEQLRRMRAKIAPLGLSDADAAKLITLTQSLHASLAAKRDSAEVLAKQMRKQPSLAQMQQLTATKVELDNISHATYENLLQVLSSDGVTRLKEHLTQIKTKIKVVPPPKM
jgi:hypothetical protein